MNSPESSEQKTVADVDLNKAEDIRFLKNLYELRKKEMIEISLDDLGLILRYIEIDSSEIQGINDKIALKGAVGFISGLFGMETGFFILRDIVPEKFRRYVAIHETVEGITHSHWYAVQDEFKVAEKELSAEDFKDYCRFRLKMHENDARTVKEIRRWVSDHTKRILSGVQKELNIVLRRRPDQH